MKIKRTKQRKVTDSASVDAVKQLIKILWKE